MVRFSKQAGFDIKKILSTISLVRLAYRAYGQEGRQFIRLAAQEWGVTNAERCTHSAAYQDIACYKRDMSGVPEVSHDPDAQEE
jgi:hypothetical protein